jgi:hypothetical protein
MNKTGLIGSSIHCVPDKLILGNDFYGTSDLDALAKLWGKVYDFAEMYQIEIDPKNIRFTKGFDISKEMYDNRGKKGSTKSRKSS